jgi:hypothetical protein
VEPSLFDDVADALRGMMPPDLGPMQLRARRYGIKVWFGSETPTREHYEAQVIGADAVADARVLAIEVGFHAEHPKLPANEAVLARLLEREAEWRSVVGEEPVGGPFLGRADTWRRVSETWPDPDLADPELALELAARLVDYATALEPTLRGS